MCKELLVVLDVDDAPALPLHYCCLLSLVKAVLLFVFFVKKVVQQVSSDCMSIVVCVCVHGSLYSYRTETFLYELLPHKQCWTTYSCHLTPGHSLF